MAEELKCLCSSGTPENYEGPARDCPVHGTPEPPDSASSSPDELCEHIREGGCCSGPGFCAHMCAAPAEPDPVRLQLAGVRMIKRHEPLCPGLPESKYLTCNCPVEPEHEHDWGEWGAVYHGGHLVWRRCATCQATESRTEGHSCPECRPEPEAPITNHTYEGDGGPCRADFCGQNCGEPRSDHELIPEPEAPERSRAMCACGFDPVEGGAHAPSCFISQPPRRPPYAVAYATDDGTKYEVALPGDATVCAQQGALVITHGSPIQGLIQIRPMEGA